MVNSHETHIRHFSSDNLKPSLVAININSSSFPSKLLFFPENPFSTLWDYFEDHFVSIYIK